MAHANFTAKKESSQRSNKLRMTPEEMTTKIRKEAQEIYERRNREPGHELEDWLTAERNVKKELGLA